MTEEEWLTSTDEYPMVQYLEKQHLKKRMSDRKFRLIGLACCGYPRDFCDPRLTALAAVIERYAEGAASYGDVWSVREIAVAEPFTSGQEFTSYDREVLVLNRFSQRNGYEALERFLFSLGATLTEQDRGAWFDPGLWCELIRDIVGNPFRPVKVEPGWLTSTVGGLARGIYDERAFDRLPILADALQDAGCDHPDVLNHCRSDGPHVRGCWVVDLLLGKT